MTSRCAPSLAKLRFLPGFEDPSGVWDKCLTAQEKWNQTLSCEEKYIKLVEEFNKKAVVKSIWTINVLEDTLPNGARKNRSEEVLSKAYEDTDVMVSPLFNNYAGGRGYACCLLVSHTRQGG